MLIIIIMNIIKIFSDPRAMARLGPGPAPPLVPTSQNPSSSNKGVGIRLLYMVSTHDVN